MYNDWHKLQNRFQDDSPSMDLEKAWSSLEAERQSRENNGGANRKYYWLLLGLLLLIGSVSMYFSQDAMIQHVTTQLELDKINNPSGQTEVKAVGIDHHERKIVKAEKGIIEKPKQIEVSKNDIAGSNSNEEKLTTTSLIKEQKYTQNQNINSEALINNNTTRSINVNASNSSIVVTDEKPIAVIGITNKAVLNATNESIQENAKMSIRNVTSAYHIPFLNPSEVNKHNSNLALPSAKFDFNKEPRNALGLSFSYGLNIRALESTDNANDTWVEKRNQLEQAKDAYGVELFYQKFLTKRFFITAGLNYTRWTDQLNYEYTEERMVSVEDVVVEIKYLSDGTIEEMLGTVDGTESQDYIATVWQKQNYLSVPILFGSHFSFDQKSGVNLALGVQVPIYRTVVGRTVDRSNTDYGIELINPEIFKKNGPVQFLANVSYVQSIGKTSSFHFGLKGGFDLSSRINESEGFTQKHYGIQLSTGIAKLF